MAITALALAAVSGLSAADSPEVLLRRALAAKTGPVTLPSGTIEVSREIVLAPDAHDLDIRGSGTVIKASDAFRGRALIVIPGGKNIRIRDLTLDGNRDVVGRLMNLPPGGTLLSRFVPDNGIVAEGVAGLEIGPMKATHIAGFVVIAGSSHEVRIHHVDVTESGGFNAQRKNAASGGIAIEEVTSDFEIHGCLLEPFAVPRLQSGPASAVKFSKTNSAPLRVTPFMCRRPVACRSRTIMRNRSGFLWKRWTRRARFACGWNGLTAARSRGIPVRKRFWVRCRWSGTQDKISGNRFTGLNVARRDSSGIFLAPGSKDITIEGNEVSGSGMSLRCVGAAPEVAASANKVLKNECSDEASVALLRY